MPWLSKTLDNHTTSRVRLFCTPLAKLHSTHLHPHASTHAFAQAHARTQTHAQIHTLALLLRTLLLHSLSVASSHCCNFFAASINHCDITATVFNACNWKRLRAKLAKPWTSTEEQLTLPSTKGAKPDDLRQPQLLQLAVYFE